MQFRLLLCSAVVALLAACKVGPDYVRPAAASSPLYKELPPQASEKRDEIWKAAQPSDSRLRTRWWELFGDTELNALDRKSVV